MTDTTDIDTSKPASEQLDLSVGMDADLELEDIQELTADLERAEALDLDSMADADLAEIEGALKALEDAAEEMRKDIVEPVLDERVEIGESCGPVSRTRGTNTWITDDEGALAAVAEAGEDPLEVASVSIGDLRDVLGAKADEYIGESEDSYYRRS